MSKADSNDEFYIEITPLMKAFLIVCLLSFGATYLYLILCYTGEISLFNSDYTCSSILLLIFFSVWFFIGIFVIGSTVSFYSCLEPLFHLISIGSIK
jgi:hypothetical protein